MSRHSVAFYGSAVGTDGSKGTAVLGSQYATMGLGWQGLWGLFPGHSAYFSGVYRLDVLIGPPVLFSLGFN